MSFNFPTIRKCWPNLQPYLDAMSRYNMMGQECLYDEIAARWRECSTTLSPPDWYPTVAMAEAYCSASGENDKDFVSRNFDRICETLKFNNLKLLERAMALVDGSAHMNVYCGFAECHRAGHRRNPCE